MTIKFNLNQNNETSALAVFITEIHLNEVSSRHFLALLSSIENPEIFQILENSVEKCFERIKQYLIENDMTELELLQILNINESENSMRRYVKTLFPKKPSGMSLYKYYISFLENSKNPDSDYARELLSIAFFFGDKVCDLLVEAEGLGKKLKLRKIEEGELSTDITLEDISFV